MKTPNRSTILQSLMTNSKAVEKAIVLLYDRQTSDEQSSRSTKHTNRKGFNSAHAKIGTYYAKWVLSGKSLTGYHYLKAREIACYYAGTQLLEAAKVKSASSDDTFLAARIAKLCPFQKTVGVGFLL